MMQSEVSMCETADCLVSHAILNAMAWHGIMAYKTGNLDVFYIKGKKVATHEGDSIHWIGATTKEQDRIIRAYIDFCVS